MVIILRPPSFVKGGACVSRRGVIYYGWRCYIRRLATPAKGVMRMGNGRWAKALRILFWFIIALALMISIAPKAC